MLELMVNDESASLVDGQFEDMNSINQMRVKGIPVNVSNPWIISRSTINHASRFVKGANGPQHMYKKVSPIEGCDDRQCFTMLTNQGLQ
jgi:hypothetical protein